MKTITPILLLALYIIPTTFACGGIGTHDLELANCKCRDGYEPKEDSGGVKCYGILIQTIQPCNLPKTPECTCSGKMTATMTDADGTWCVEQENGKVKMRWECENKEEWMKYFEENPGEKH